MMRESDRTLHSVPAGLDRPPDMRYSGYYRHPRTVLFPREAGVLPCRARYPCASFQMATKSCFTVPLVARAPRLLGQIGTHLAPNLLEYPRLTRISPNTGLTSLSAKLMPPIHAWSSG